jgi:hypothetical protein
MSERLTPETDAMEFNDPLCDPAKCVESEFARRLERERDEWRKKAVDLHKSLIEVSRMGVDLLVERDKTRDFLREMFNITQIGDPHPADLPMKALKAIAEMIDEHLKEARK